MQPYLRPYLNFNGNAKEVMEFYHATLGGDVTYNYVKDTPMKDQFPADKQNNVMHSELTNEQIRLCVSDMSHETFVQGNNVSIMIEAISEEQLRGFYDKLSIGGTVFIPPHDSFWGAIFTSFVDQFGTHWAIHFYKGEV